ncbi:MAG: hypothetical protein H0X65_15365 [Gemmatimonadetes bacterium]|nr:hypothetical protein [Gemmatimonadota bacterium]
MYRCRWQGAQRLRRVASSSSSSGPEQHLRIKAFYGTSENAVKTQIRIALSAALHRLESGEIDRIAAPVQDPG